MVTSCSVLGMFEANWSDPSTPLVVEQLLDTRAECINKDECSHECNAFMSFSQQLQTKQSKNVWILRCNCFALSALELTRKRNQCHHWQHTVINFKQQQQKKNSVIFIRNSFQLIARHRASNIRLNSQFQFHFAVSFCVGCVNGGRTTHSYNIARWAIQCTTLLAIAWANKHIVGWNMNKQNMFKPNECNSRSDGAYKERQMVQKRAQIDFLMVSFNHGRKWPTAHFLLQCHIHLLYIVYTCCGCSHSVRCNSRNQLALYLNAMSIVIVWLGMKISSWKWISNIKCVISPSLPSPPANVLSAHHQWSAKLGIYIFRFDSCFAIFRYVVFQVGVAFRTPMR